MPITFHRNTAGQRLRFTITATGEILATCRGHIVGHNTGPRSTCWARAQALAEYLDTANTNRRARQ